MPGKPDKPHRIRVRVIDGKAREPNKLKGQLVPHVDVHDAKDKIEFIICAVKEAHLEPVRAKLGAAGLEEIAGDTSVSPPVAPKPAKVQHGRRELAPSSAQRLPGKPYGFVPLPKEMTSSPPVWHDGTSSDGRLSGEIRFELETLTPLLVGWERQMLNDTEETFTIPTTKVNRAECAAFVLSAARSVYPDATNSDAQKRQKIEADRRKYIERVQDHVVDLQVPGSGWSIDSKSVLCPLRAPWGKRPVVIPGDSLKGLLRHELGALLGAPMERVAERSYSYRPNSMFAKGAQLIPRLARVPTGGVEMKPLDSAYSHKVRVPTRLELLPENLEFDSPRLQRRPASNYYRFDDGNGAAYRGGQGAGERLNSKRNLHKKLTVNPGTPTKIVDVPESVQQGYLATLRHLTDDKAGHFSERHPDGKQVGDAARTRILAAATNVVFQPNDLIWVEWDTQDKRVVSLGWHYYYRWAYTDSVHRRGGGYERHGLFPLEAERTHDDEGAPCELSPIRRLFGYTGDNEGSKGIGKDDHSQLMGRVSVNAGLEVVEDGDTDDKRFLPPTFLKELGMPRPSAVEHYVQQPHHPKSRPSDQAALVTYGDAVGYDTPGELAGRKFYLDREDAYTGKPWEDDSPANRANDRSTLALEASRPGRRFRFTIRFRDLDPTELAAIVVALCPHQLRAVLRGDHTNGYCSKLGYARPLGWGSVRIEAKVLLLLDAADNALTLNAVPDVVEWVRANHRQTVAQREWLDVHRHKHPDAADYPRSRDKDGNENIYTFHTTLRAEHSRARRYRPERSS